MLLPEAIGCGIKIPNCQMLDTSSQVVHKACFKGPFPQTIDITIVLRCSSEPY